MGPFCQNSRRLPPLRACWHGGRRTETLRRQQDLRCRDLELSPAGRSAALHARASQSRSAATEAETREWARGGPQAGRCGGQAGQGAEKESEAGREAGAQEEVEPVEPGEHPCLFCAS